jgi:hypothetical protein
MIIRDWYFSLRLEFVSLQKQDEIQQFYEVEGMKVLQYDADSCLYKRIILFHFQKTGASCLVHNLAEKSYVHLQSAMDWWILGYFMENVSMKEFYGAQLIVKLIMIGKQGHPWNVSRKQTTKASKNSVICLNFGPDKSWISTYMRHVSEFFTNKTYIV